MVTWIVKKYTVLVNGKDLATYPVTQNEVWKEIPGYEGLYEASSCGRIRSLKRKWRTSGIVLKTAHRADGYISVSLTKDRKKKTFAVHRLILSTFRRNPNKQKFTQVNHINSIRSDNRIENLEWSNNSLNQKHSFLHGNQDNKGIKHPFHKLNNNDVRKIKLGLFCGISSGSLSNIFNISKPSIKDIRNGRTWKHIKLKTL